MPAGLGLTIAASPVIELFCCENMAYAPIISFLLACLQASTAVGSPLRVSYSSAGTPTNLLITNTRVFVTIENTLHIFSSDLSVEGSFTRNAEISRIIETGDPYGNAPVLICLNNGCCDLFIHSLPDQYDCMVPVPLFTHNAMMALSRVEEDFYIASTSYDAAERFIKICQFHSIYSSFLTEAVCDAKAIDNQNFISRSFTHSFSDTDYIYFIMVDNTTQEDRGIKLMRKCHERNSTESVMRGTFEVELDCGPLAADVTLVSFSKLNETAILGLYDTVSGSRFCFFNTTHVNEEISQAYQLCMTGSYEFRLPWSAASTRPPCEGFSEVATSECDFGMINDHNYIMDGVIGVSHPLRATTFRLDSEGELQELTAITLVDISGVQYLYAALTSASNQSTINKYLFFADSHELIPLDIQAMSSPVSLMATGKDYVYATTTHKLMRFDVDNCQTYTNCSSCTNSGDSLCGWCTLQAECSSHAACSHNTLRHRWIQNEESCLAESFLFESNIIAVDNLKPVKVINEALDADFPKLVEGESFVCVGSDLSSGLELVVPVIQIGLDTYCDFSESNITTMKPIGISMVMSIVNEEETVVFTSSQNIIFHNCSLNQRCSQCEQIEACGWCPYKTQCTGNKVECYNEGSWISKQDKNPRKYCPVVLPATFGSYVLPVAVAENLSLITRNIPPPVDGIEYVCEFKYSSGDYVYTPVVYNNHSQIFCQVRMNQMRLSSMSKHTGVEQLELSVWTNSSRGLLYQIEHFHVINDDGYLYDSVSSSAPAHSQPHIRSASMTVYNCSVFDSCTLCTLSNVGTQFNCVWCSNLDSCTDLQSCFSPGNSVLINSSDNCYAPPVIKSVVPNSGPTTGGTKVTVNGTDLGATAQELNVMLGNSVCEVIEAEYVPGKQVSCESPRHFAPPGAVVINVTVNRGNGNNPRRFFIANFEESVNMEFVYAQPAVHNVTPSFGPKSGGTHVVVRGKDLTVGNTDLLSVDVADIGCSIQSFTSSEIHCISSAASSPVANSSVTVVIDSLRFTGIFYSYTEDPQYHSVNNNTIIPAGGITLRFSGSHLNVAAQPRLVVFIGSISYYSATCVTEGATVLECVSPRFPSPFQAGSGNIVKRSRGNMMVLNYTLELDGAPGPNISMESLAIFLKPDPVLLEINVDEADIIYVPGESISISGRNLDSVHPSEISVTLVGETCTIIEVTSVVLICMPPDLPVVSDRYIEVQISVASGALEFSVGSILYRGTSEPHWTPVIIGCASLAAVTAVLLCLMGILCIICIKRRNRLARIEYAEDVGNHMHAMQVNKPALHEHEENLYEIIPDHMQNSGGHVIQSSGANGVENSNGVDHVTSTMATNMVPGTTGYHGSLVVTPEQNGAIVNGIISNHMHNSSDDYVKMCSHSVSNNFNAAQNEIESDEVIVNHDSASVSTAEYIDMQPIDEGTAVSNGTQHRPLSGQC